MAHDPYHYQRLGIAYKDYSPLREMDNGRGWVDPYAAEARGIPYRAWSEYVEREKRERSMDEDSVECPGYDEEWFDKATCRPCPRYDVCLSIVEDELDDYR